MPRFCTGLIALLVAIGVHSANVSAADSGKEPLRASEVISLVAGNALPEDIVADINTDHLAFRPDDYYRGLLKAAGADPTVIAAVDAAKVETEQSPETESGKDLLQQLADAATAMKVQHYDEASAELKSALVASLNSPDCYFVMGELMQRASAYDQAAAAYKEVLSQEPDFPEVHSKLSFALYKAGNANGALPEAEAAGASAAAEPDPGNVASCRRIRGQGRLGCGHWRIPQGFPDRRGHRPARQDYSHRRARSAN